MLSKVKGIKFPVFWSLESDWLNLVGPLTPFPELGVELAISLYDGLCAN